jgi:hypothetical protein
MKKALLYAACFFSGAVIFGVIGIFFGYSLGHSNEPAVVIVNVSKASIQKIRIETDVGESYEFGSLAPYTSRRMKISGRKKAAWIVAVSDSGEKKESQTEYVASEGMFFAVITDTGIAVDYEL